MRSCIALLLVGCGAVAHSSPDAAVDMALPDAPTSTPRCDLTKPFGPVTQVPGIDTTSSEENAWLSPDELTIEVTSVRSSGVGSYDVFYATRATRDAAFGTPIPMQGVNTMSNEERPSLTADGLTMFCSSNNAAATLGSFDILFATRTSTTGDFGPLAEVSGVNSSGQDAEPDISADGRTLYFSSNRDGNANIYRATRAGATGPFGGSAIVAELSLPGVNTGSPVVSDDELAIYFSSDRPGSLDTSDIWYATRSSVGDGFGAPVRIAELATASLEWPVWLSPDGCRLYFASSRPGMGNYDVWYADRGM